MSSTDRIEKEIVIRAPRAKVWQALVDPSQFGQWFGVRLESAFAPGARVRGRITHPGYDHLTLDLVVETMEGERRLAWRWHPHAVDTARDYSAEPMTLVTFELSDVPGGTRLSVVESGFDAIPDARRAEAWRGNERGWEGQMANIERHVAGAR